MPPSPPAIAPAPCFAPLIPRAPKLYCSVPCDISTGPLATPSLPSAPPEPPAHPPPPAPPRSPLQIGHVGAGSALAKGDTYAAASSIGWREFAIKEEILKAIQEAGWEHPSEVQQQSIPKAVAGADVICQAKAGRGKTGVFVISVLQQLDVVQVEDGKESVVNECRALVMCHTRELALQIQGEFNRLKAHLTPIRVEVYVGGSEESKDIAKLKKEQPHVAVGTPGRIKSLVERGALKVASLQHFILDECDKMLEKMDMRGDVQKIFMKTPAQVTRRIGRDP